jgi:hypothetical protein
MAHWSPTNSAYLYGHDRIKNLKPPRRRENYCLIYGDKLLLQTLKNMSRYDDIFFAVQIGHCVDCAVTCAVAMHHACIR